MATRYFAGLCLKKVFECESCISILVEPNEKTVATPSQYLILQDFHDSQNDLPSIRLPSHKYFKASTL